MKLQVNLSGSWRAVISFAEIDEAAVKAHARELAKIAGEKVSWRIADSQNTALARLVPPEYMWRPV